MQMFRAPARSRCSGFAFAAGGLFRTHRRQLSGPSFGPPAAGVAPSSARPTRRSWSWCGVGCRGSCRPGFA